MYTGTLTKRIECLIHLSFWIFTAYFTFVNDPFLFKFFIPDLFFSTYTLVFVTTFYLHYLFVMKWVFKAFKWKRVFAGLFISFAFFTALRWFTEQVLTGIIFNKINYTHPSFFSYSFDNIHYSIKPIIFSSFLWLVIYFIRLTEEKKNTEIKFLKGQINPHFVFNTLNNIYSMVYFQSDKSLPAIAKLGEVMRFTTYYSQKEIINLQDEVNYIKAHIELEQFRHEENAFVDLKINVNDESLEIPPYTLSPLVENALKHGLASNQNPIKMELNINSKKLSFLVKNEIGTQKKDKLAGIGLDNLKKRLEIYYPAAHTLTLSNENNHFTALLEIDLK